MGSARTNAAGSGTAAGGIDTRPEPRRWEPPLAVRAVPVGCVPPDPGPLEVVAEGIDGIDGVGGVVVGGPPPARTSGGAFVPQTLQ